jgi:hypothetical protein
MAHFVDQSTVKPPSNGGREAGASGAGGLKVSGPPTDVPGGACTESRPWVLESYVQRSIPRSELLEPVVESPGFTLIEEDDVAFSLRLCREVNRIYLEYQEGRLPSSAEVQAGLAVTMEMLAVLSQRVTDGMPGMRITVAAAQTREMLAVVFGQDPMFQPLDQRYRKRNHALVSESARRLSPRAELESPDAGGQGARHLSNRRRWFGRRRT